jgi:hypothetical protein
MIFYFDIARVARLDAPQAFFAFIDQTAVVQAKRHISMEYHRDINE